MKSELRQARELGEVRAALFDEGVLAFLAFFGHVVEQRGVTSQFLDTGLTVAVGVQGSLQAADGDRAIGKDLTTPLDRFFFQLLKRNHGIDQAPLKSRLCVVLTAQEPNSRARF